MATLGVGNLTLADWAKRQEPNGKTAKIVELLAQTNAVIEDMVWIEGNQATGHTTTVRTGLPTSSYRLLNQGTVPSKSTTTQVTETIGILEAWSEVDKDLADLNGDVGMFRLQEAQAFIESMNQEFVQTLFYGNANTAPEEFSGFSSRYNSLSGDISQNVLAGGGAGVDNSSVWLICWANNTSCGIFPKGSQAGLRHDDMGEVTAEVTAGLPGSRLRVYQDRWQWKAGLSVKDWRYAARICNIDISNLVAKSSAADLIELMIKATHVIPNLMLGKCVFYMNRTCFQMLDIQRYDNVAGAGLTYADVDGRRTPMFRNIPIRIVDQLTETEALVS